jgi:hypothetical protein
MNKTTRNGLIALGAAAFAYWKYKMTPEQKDKLKNNVSNLGKKIQENAQNITKKAQSQVNNTIGKLEQ